MPEIKEVFKFESVGAQTVGAGKDRWEAPFPGQILGAAAVVGTAPTGAALVVDILLNGTSVYGSNTKPTIAAGATQSPVANTPNDPANAVTRFAAGDVLSLSVTQIGSTVAGSDLDVTVSYIAS